ncbi:restriction endonuclease [Paraburkholderia tropica]|uniref:restriction endonuclease n=2 Tax=Paraburkholderia tropica TaxID=92647 RepID=UPI002AB7A231|nr:restriction endonuclease [Paraburkholderia tropica]
MSIKIEQAFFEGVTVATKKSGLFSRWRHSSRLDIFDPTQMDFFLALEIDRTGLIVAFFIFRTSSWHYDGERTDLHDGQSLLFSLSCAVQGLSVSLWDIKNEFSEAEGELYGRYATITQPNLSVITQDEPGLAAMGRLIELYSAYRSLLSSLYSSSPSNRKYSWRAPKVQELRSNLVTALAVGVDDVLCNERSGPDWIYLRIYKKNISAFKSTVVRNIFKVLQSRDEMRNDSTVYVKSAYSRHAYSNPDLEFAEKLSSALSVEPVEYLATESHILLRSGDWLIARRGEFGVDRFYAERAAFSTAIGMKLQFLYDNARLHWASGDQSERFEALCRELLAREPGILRTRKVSPTYQPDRGRDLIAEKMQYRPLGMPVEQNAQPVNILKYVVQCKYSARTVGIPSAAGPFEVLYQGDYDGYFLITNSVLSSDFTALLEKLRMDRRYTADWWSCDEIEERLKRNVDLIEKYRDIVSYVPFKAATMSGAEG